MGTRDKQYVAYQQHCSTHSIPALFLPGTDHSLELSHDPPRSIEILKEYLTFLDHLL